MAKTIATRKPTGVSIKRSHAAFIISWKCGDKDYGRGQNLQYRFPGGDWTSIDVGYRTTKATLIVDVSQYYPNTSKILSQISFRLRGRRARFTLDDVEYNPLVSPWVTKTYDILTPNVPTLTATLSSTQSNKCTFEWQTDVGADYREWFSSVECQTRLIKNSNIADGSKLSASGWSATPGSGGSSGSREFTEDNSQINNDDSYTRWFRVRARGPQGDSAWRYACHVYGIPFKTKNVTASAKANGSNGYTCSAKWTTPKSTCHPVDNIVVQYVFATPESGLNCPSGLTWTDAVTLAYRDGSDAATWTIDRRVTNDECLYVRINTVHDSNTTYGSPVRVATGDLSAPSGVTASADISDYSAVIGATNNSQMGSSFLLIKYYSTKYPRGINIGVIPHGENSAMVQCPAWTSNTNIKFGVQAVVGSYTYTTRSDNVRIYSVTDLADSAIVKESTYGGSVPVAPSSVTLSKAVNAGAVRVNWNCPWSAATGVELSWSDQSDAWHSTQGPQRYDGISANVNVFNVSGLDVTKRWYIRVRLYQELDGGTVYSGYSKLQYIDLSDPPAAPDVTLSRYMISEKGVVTVYWAYDTSDGTTQAAAEVAERYVSNGNTVYKRLATVKTARRVQLRASEHTWWDDGETHLICVRVTSNAGKKSDWSDPAALHIENPLTCSISETNLVAESRNVLENTASTTTNNGVTYTVRDDGTVKAAGTATADAALSIYFTPDAGTYYFNGSIGGSESTYYVFLYDVTDSHMAYQWDGTTALICTDGESEKFRAEAGHQYRMTLRVKQGTTVNTIFYPMVRRSTDYDDSYEFYREIPTLKTMPLRVKVLGAGTGGTTTVAIERAEDYHLDRPDERDYNGFRGETVASYTQTGEAEIRFNREDVLGYLDDGARYRIVATVEDDFGQSATARRTFEVHWTHQARVPQATASIDADRMAAIIKPIAPDGALSTDTCDIYRLSVDRPELIYPNAKFGVKYVDPYPAIGEYGGHRVVFRTLNGDYITNSGRLAWVDLRAPEGDIFESEYNVIDFGSGRVLLRYNVDLTNGWEKDFAETKYLGGSVQGDWNPAVSRKSTLSSAVVTTDDDETIEAMRRLATYAGICHVRTKDGSSYPADVQVSESYAQDMAHKVVTFDLTITRVDPEGFEGMTYSNWISTEDD